MGKASKPGSVGFQADEFGGAERLNAPARLAWLTAVRKACEREQIGWTLWGYDDSMGLGLWPATDRHQIDPAVLVAVGLMPSNNH